MSFCRKQNKIQDKNIAIITRDLNKQLIFFMNTKNLIEKLATFKRKKWSKYINLTKNFLIDPEFLKFADFLLKKHSNGVGFKLEKVGNKIFIDISIAIKKGIYKIGCSKQIEGFEFGTSGIKKNKIVILNRKDQILQHGIFILLAMIYEKNQGIEFNWNTNHHDVLRYIKQGWACLPYYLEINLGQSFDIIHCHVLINFLKKKICDKRLLDLLFKMYRGLLLCPVGFYLNQKNNKIQASSFSLILCNLFLSKFDGFVKNIFSMSCTCNFSKLSRVSFNHSPYHLRFFRLNNWFQTPSLKKNCNKIRYIRYLENCLFGIKGSYFFVFNLKTRLKNFVQSVFHLKIKPNALKIINTYSNKVKFLGVIIYNQRLAALFSQKSPFLEKILGFYKKKFLSQKIKQQKTCFIETQCGSSSSNMQDFMFNISPYVNGEPQKQVSQTNSVSFSFLKSKHFFLSNYLFFFKIVCKLITHYFLFFFISTQIKRAFFTSLIWINFKTCNIIEFADFLILFKISGLHYKWFFFSSWGFIQNLFLQQFKKYILLTNKKENGFSKITPVIVCDIDRIQKDLIALGMLNLKKKSICFFQVVSENDFFIVLYYKNLALYLLNYYRCVDNFYKIQNLVNWFLRNSLILTLKYKHKISSTKVLLKKFGVALHAYNNNNTNICFLTSESIFCLKKKYLSNFLIFYSLKIK